MHLLSEVSISYHIINLYVAAQTSTTFVEHDQSHTTVNRINQYRNHRCLSQQVAVKNIETVSPTVKPQFVGLIVMI